MFNHCIVLVDHSKYCQKSSGNSYGLPQGELDLDKKPSKEFEGKAGFKKRPTLRGSQLEDFSGHNELEYQFAHAVNGFFTLNEAQAATRQADTLYLN